MRLSLLFGVLVASALAFASPAAASFQWVEPVPGPLNVDPDAATSGASITSVAGRPYVVWAEPNLVDHPVRVKRMNAAGTAWEEFAGPLDTAGVGNNNGNARIAAVGTVPYVAWEREASGYDVHVKRLNSTDDGWEEPTGVLDTASGDGAGPDIAVAGTTPYVAWSQDGTSREIRVKRFDGVAWVEPVVAALNVGANDAAQPSIAVLGSTPYVAWREQVGAVGQIYVKRFNGAAWEEPQAGPLNVDAARDANTPSLAVVGDRVYLAWRETNADGVTQIRVKRLNVAGTAWSEVVSGSLNVDATRNAASPSLASIAGVPFVAWSEPNADDLKLVRVKRLDAGETAWVEPVAGALNVDPTQPGDSPSIADIGSAAYVAWHEGAPASPKLRVKRLVEVADPDPGGAPGGGSPGGSSGGGGGGGPTAIASAGALTLSPSAFPAASSGASVAAKRKRKTGTTVRYRLSAAARVRFTAEKRSSGRKVGRRCVKPTRANKRKRKCTRFTAVRGSFTHTGKAGQNSLRFTGRLNRRKLAPGSYRLIATPLATDGRRGTPIRKTFRITP